MESLGWKDVSEKDASKKQISSSFKASTATPWFGATMLLIGMIIGFILKNLVNL